MLPGREQIRPRDASTAKSLEAPRQEQKKPAGRNSFGILTHSTNEKAAVATPLRFADARCTWQSAGTPAVMHVPFPGETIHNFRSRPRRRANAKRRVWAYFGCTGKRKVAYIIALKHRIVAHRKMGVSVA